MRSLNLIIGVILISAAAAVYATGPTVKFVAQKTVNRFVEFATPTLSLAGMALIAVAGIRARGKKTTAKKKPKKA